jgi:hypothetical protein
VAWSGVKAQLSKPLNGRRPDRPRIVTPDLMGAH